MTQQAYSKPLPTTQPESDFYWEKTKEHELWLRSCNDCSQAYFYPRDICPVCFSRNTTWVQASGKGTLHTFAIVHRAAHAGLPRRRTLRGRHRRPRGGPAHAHQPGGSGAGPIGDTRWHAGGSGL